VWRAHLDVPRTTFHVLEEGGAVVAYAVCGKGRDLQGCIHEWHAPDLVLPELLGAVLAVRPAQPLHLLVPPFRGGAVDLLRGLGLAPVVGSLCMIQIPDPAALLAALAPLRATGDSRSDVTPALAQDLFGSPESSRFDARLALPFYLTGLDSM
jgi:hypothetical protein